MAEVSTFESREAKLNSSIDKQVTAIRGEGEFNLPGRATELVQCYVQKIEGSYDVKRAKKDTESAIDLLYIAYNTTPQEEGAIRVKISRLMDRLIVAQQQSSRTMASAMRTSDAVLNLLKNGLPEWMDAKEGKNPEELKDFVKSELLPLTREIEKQARAVQAELTAIAVTYDLIIKETATATDESQIALAKRMDENTAIEDEINKANAERARLDSLVEDLKAEVAKFEKMANTYQEKAQRAEDRAFIMSIVRVGAQVVSAALPAVAMAAGGPGSVIAASTRGRTTEVKDDASGASGKSGAKSDSKADDTEDAIKTRKDISENKAKLEDAKKKVESLTDKKKKLKKELDDKAKQNPKKAAAAKTPAGTKGTKPTQSDEEDEITEDDSEAEKAVKERIQEANKELKEEQEKVSALTSTLLGLKASLDALEKGLSKLTEDQQSQAANLYQLQMQMLDKADQYEKERRTQTSELVKITALLKGQRSRQETIQLCIKSLNLSLSALKRTKEIIEEIAFFFKSFADFMQAVGTEALIQSELLQKAAASEKKMGSYALKNLLLSTDEFFIRQAAEWHATWFVAEKFNQCFDRGWSKLNELSGKYITGDELAAYLKKAADLLESIVAERESAANQKIVAIDECRRLINQDIAA